MTDAQIWKVGPREVHEAMELIKESFSYDEVEALKLLKEKVRSEKELLLLAKFDGKAVGLLEAEIMERSFLSGKKMIGVIYTILIKEKHRRKGVGRQLTDTAIIWFRVNQATETVCNLPHDDVETADFLKKLEFLPYQVRMRREIEPFSQ